MFRFVLSSVAAAVLFLGVVPENAAPIKQLYTGDLMPGDILIKVGGGDAVSAIIRQGQRAFKTLNVDKTHAGLMYDNYFIIEADGLGVIANDLRIQNKAYGYVVFRSNNKDLEIGAAQFAKMLFDAHDAQKNLKYGLLNAVRSGSKKPKSAKTDQELEKVVDGIIRNKTKKFFCSELVVFVYQFVARQNDINPKEVFDLDDALVAPAKLAELLTNNHAYFREIGYLMPNERFKG